MVHQKEIFKKIGAIIVEISEQYQYLSENPEQLNDLELELFSANADFLSEHVKILRRVNIGLPVAPKQETNNEPARSPEKTVPVVEEKQSEVIQQPNEQAQIMNTISETKPEAISSEVEFQSAPVYQPALSFEEREPELIETISEPPPSTTIEAETVPSRIYEEKAEEIIPNIAVAEEPIAIKTPEVETKYFESPVPVIERPVNSPAPTLNDLISAQKTQTIRTNSQFSQGASISDLKTSISLNDKLLFIKDLFNGYSLAYSEAIEILNRFDSFDVADTFLKTNYANKNNWAAKQNAVDKFYDILRRRYSK